MHSMRLHIIIVQSAFVIENRTELSSQAALTGDHVNEGV